MMRALCSAGGFDTFRCRDKERMLFENLSVRTASDDKFQIEVDPRALGENAPAPSTYGAAVYGIALTFYALRRPRQRPVFHPDGEWPEPAALNTFCRTFAEILVGPFNAEIRPASVALHRCWPHNALPAETEIDDAAELATRMARETIGAPVPVDIEGARKLCQYGGFVCYDYPLLASVGGVVPSSDGVFKIYMNKEALSGRVNGDRGALDREIITTIGHEIGHTLFSGRTPGQSPQWEDRRLWAWLDAQSEEVFCEAFGRAWGGQPMNEYHMTSTPKSSSRPVRDHRRRSHDRHP